MRSPMRLYPLVHAHNTQLFHHNPDYSLEHCYTCSHSCHVSTACMEVGVKHYEASEDPYSTETQPNWLGKEEAAVFYE